MKRLIVLTILVTTAISTTGCRRGLRSWGIRGARCGAPVAPAYTPVPAYPAAPVYPTVPCPPVSAPAYDVCPTVPYSGGYGGVMDGGVIDGGVIGTPTSTINGGSGAAFQTPTIESVPSTYEGAGAYQMKRFNPTVLNPVGLPGGQPGIDLSNQVAPNRPIFSHVIGDRKLQPSETLKGAYQLPVESAAAPASDKK